LFEGLTVTTKNLLRGLLDAKGDEKQIETLNRLRRRVTFKESRIVNDLLLDHQLFRHLKLPVEFPSAPSNFETHLRLMPQSLENELNCFASRIRLNKEKIVWALEALEILNGYLLSGDLIDAVSIAEEIEAKVGCSFILLTKLTYIYSKMRVGSAEKDLCAKWLSKYGLSSNNLVALSLADTMGETYSLFSVRKNILGISQQTSERRFTVDLAKFVHEPLTECSDEFHAVFQSFLQSSLIDAAYYYCIHRYNSPDRNVLPNSGTLTADIDDILKLPWHSISQVQIELSDVIDLTCDHADFLFYRQSLTWIELEEVTKYRKVVDYYYSDQEKPKTFKGSTIDVLADTYFEGFNDVKQLLVHKQPERLNLAKFDVEYSGYFSRTMAFIRLLEQTEGAITITSVDLMRLMGLTRDVAEIANRVYLAQIAKTNSDKLTQFVVNCLIGRRSRKGVDTFRLRRTLEAIVIERFDGDLLSFVRFLDESSSAVADFVYELCDEAFLSQLFRLFEETDGFYECRADLHDWYGKKHDDPLFAERAKTLRIDLRLQKIRGEIDDTRIYVDPNRFTEWLQDNLFSELSSILRTQRIAQLSLILPELKTDIVAQQKPEVRMAALISKAFEEFCGNTKFGISSYLGRRIRHGTLKGTMITPVRSLIESAQFKKLLSHPDFSRQLYKWLDAYEQGVEELSSEYLQVYTNKKSKGLFSSDVYRQDRAAILRTAILDVDKTYAETGSFPHVNAKVYSYCWRFADIDLRKIREHLRRCRQAWGLVDAGALRRSAPRDMNIKVNLLVRELGTMLDERFRTVTSWFNEPKNLSPSAPLGLLFQAVMSEVSESFREFQPEIVENESEDIILSGGSYHLIYDALYVIIYNAAKHGDPIGELVFKISTAKLVGDKRELVINISSKNIMDSVDSEVEKNIHDAMLGSNDDALATEGRSGFKKLMRMESDTQEMTRFNVKCENGRVTVECVFGLYY